MLDICLLGTGGMMPLPNRYLTSLMTRYKGSLLLIDCGEATQLAIKEHGFGFKNIDTICFTHFHADHISGLPGLLLTMGNALRTEPLNIIGPKGVKKVVNSLRVIAPELPFDINFIEIENNDEVFYLYEYNIKPFKVNHNVSCYGYSISIERPGKFNPDKAKALNIPIKLWSRLQKGEIITENNITYEPEMVLGEQRKGIKITYCTDTRPTKSIVENAYKSDLFICEGMYGIDDKDVNAKKYKHMTMKEACTLAKEAKVQELWLTHYSPSLTNPTLSKDELRKIFKNTKVCRDGRYIELKFMENDNE